MTRASNFAFGVALALYLASMVAYFHSLAFSRPRGWVIARAVAAAGLAAHGLSIGLRGAAAGRVPWGNMYEYASVVGFFTVAGYLLLVERAPRARPLGGFAVGAAVLTMGAATLIYVPPGPLVPALNSYWIRIHVLAAVLASALFTLGFVFTVLYLVREARERRAAGTALRDAVPTLATVGAGLPHDLSPESDEPAEVVTLTVEDGGNGSRGRRLLPDAATLDRLAYRVIAFAFPIWTFAIIAGAIWAEQAWGRYWAWDPKEVWSFITWVLFAGYLHARATVGWRGRRAAILAAAGFVALVFNVAVVNLVVSGLHSYAGV